MFAERLRHIPFCFTDLLRKTHQNSRHQLPSFVESFRQFWSVTYLCWLLSMIVDCVCRPFNISMVTCMKSLIIQLEALHSSSMVSLSTLWQGTVMSLALGLLTEMFW